MPTIKLTGVLTDIFPVETKPNFSKRIFWLKEPDRVQYPQQWEIELHNEETRRINEFQTGDVLEVEVEVRGRKWKQGTKEKIFVSLKAVGIRCVERIGKSTNPFKQ